MEKERRNMIEEIVIASNNKGKIRQFQEVLKELKIIPMKEIGINIDIEEDQDTFKGNAIKKAEEISKRLNGKWCMADDSGIEIEYLDGFPGVQTKRWLEGTDRERNLAIIEKLKDVPKEKRKIKFSAAIAISNGEKTICEIGEIFGCVSQNPRGESGFGFDEIFELEDGKTLSELPQEEINKRSARRVALERLKDKIRDI